MSENTVRAVDRALDVLLCFTKQTPQLSMSQIAAQVGIHKSTVHRLLATLEERDFVERDPASGLYRPGINLLHLAFLSLENNDLRQICHPYLHQLRDQFQETVNLSVLDQAVMVYLDVVESPQRVKLAAAIGQRLPAYCTASGKAFLAFSPPEVVEAVLAQGMSPHTCYTIVDREVYTQNLDQIRERGFGFSIEEFEEGITAVAAPILDRDQRPFAAIAVAGPSFRLTEQKLLEIGPVLMETAAEISQEIDYINP